jgi:ribose transport system substrate-binding protein
MTTRSTRMLRPVIAVVMGAGFGCLLALLPHIRCKPSLPVIAFVARTSGTNFTEDMHRGAQAAAQSAGYQIYWNAPTREDDLDRQILIAQNAVHQGSKALILGPTNVWGVTTMVDSLVARKVPIVFVQTELPMSPRPYLTSVTPDQSQFGTLAADRIAHVTGNSGEIALIGVDRAAPETRLRAESFMRAITRFPGLDVVAQSPGSEQILEAEQSTRELVSAYPRLKAIFAASADATQGAMLALRDSEAGRKIALVGCDRDLFLLDNLHQGQLDSLVVADGYRIGYLAVRSAVAMMQGHPFQSPLHVEATLLTQDVTVASGH